MTEEKLEEQIKKVAKLGVLEREQALSGLKDLTGIGITTLRKIIKNFGTEFNAYNVATDRINKDSIITSESVDKIYYYKDGIYVEAEKQISKKLQHKLKHECSIQRVKEILEHIKRETYKTEDEIFESNENFICVENGLYNINKNEIIDFDKNKYFFNKIPVPFIKGADCPEFKTFLRRACIKSNDIFSQEKYNTIQEFMGYCLEKGYPIHKILLIYGPSDTSKTQFMIILQNMLGKDNHESIFPQQLQKDNYVIMLYKMMANIADEIPGGEIASARIKGLSGDSTTTGRELFGKPFKFDNEAKLIFAGNKLPKLKDDDMDDDAIFNRPIFINFDNKILNTEMIKDYGKSVFEKEKSGILNFMIEGLKRLRKQKKFSSSKTWQENKETWMSQTEHIYQFFIECNDVELKIGGNAPKTDLYEIYTEWCDNNGIQWLENNAFGRKIKCLFKGRVIDAQLTDKTGNKQQIHTWVGVNIKGGILDIV